MDNEPTTPTTPNSPPTVGPPDTGSTPATPHAVRPTAKRGESRDRTKAITIVSVIMVILAGLFAAAATFGILEGTDDTNLGKIPATGELISTGVDQIDLYVDQNGRITTDGSQATAVDASMDAASTDGSVDDWSRDDDHDDDDHKKSHDDSDRDKKTKEYDDHESSGDKHGDDDHHGHSHEGHDDDD